MFRLGQKLYYEEKMCMQSFNIVFFLFLACNVVSQTPEGSFTMVVPQQHRNCSFSIIYPVEIQIGELSLGQHNDLKVSIGLESK